MGSCNVSNEYCDLFQDPTLTTITNLESQIVGILGLEQFQAILSAVSSTETNSKIGIKPIYISKFWIR